jgi:hypothetical protein
VGGAAQLRSTTRTRTAVRAILLLVVIAAVVAGAAVAWQRSAPGPDGAQLAREALVAAPVPAVELGREHLDPRRGWWGAEDRHGLARVADELDLTPEAAMAAWVTADGAQYGLDPVQGDGRLIATGFAGERFVVVSAGSEVELPPGEDPAGHGFTAPVAGRTVVTVEVGVVAP